jgi:hypothetical protein
MAHLTIAASESTLQGIFEDIRKKFKFVRSDSSEFGPFTAGYSLEAHLEGGTLDLRADNTIQIRELDIKWDKLDLTLGVDLPGFTIPGFCIIPNPFGGCILGIPDTPVFDNNPDVAIFLPLGDLITSEISVTGSLQIKYAINPDRPAGTDDWTAQDADPSQANHWQLFVDPQFLDVDLFDIADMVGDVLDTALHTAVENLLSFLPDEILDVLGFGVDFIVNKIRELLDLQDDIEERLSDLLNNSFGILDFILQLVADYFANLYPLHQIEDPYPMLDEANNPNQSLPKLLPVKIPIRDLKVFNDDQEMVLEGNIG